jgi:hypothetical protein
MYSVKVSARKIICRVGRTPFVIISPWNAFLNKLYIMHVF